MLHTWHSEEKEVAAEGATNVEVKKDIWYHEADYAYNVSGK